ncbi:immunity 22 family protein [Stenotrophomonas sp.]|uniref:immunity 22 family protein n=1 Tax=Stenotrophomonas sp. TaxID=69392 RepID=UPI002FC902C0
MPPRPPAYTDAFMRQVAHEAYAQTPPGGIAEVAARHGVDAAEVSQWLQRWFPPAPAPYSAVHVWLGDGGADETRFHAYFEASPAYWEVEDPSQAALSVTGCGFSIDLGERHLYDGDLFGVDWRPAPVPAAELFDGWPLEADTEAAIVQAADAAGLQTASAMFLYFDPGQCVREPDKRYNGLRYLGLFANR